MINKIDKFIILEIYDYLYNHEIMIMYQISNEINKKLPIENLIHFMNYRYHPIVFNIFDNYCFTCNQGIILYNEDEKIDTIQCNHNI